MLLAFIGIAAVARYLVGVRSLQPVGARRSVVRLFALGWGSLWLGAFLSLVLAMPWYVAIQRWATRLLSGPCSLAEVESAVSHASALVTVLFVVGLVCCFAAVWVFLRAYARYQAVKSRDAVAGQDD